MRKTFLVNITLTEAMLGTKAADPNVFATFIASKHPEGTPQKDELEAAEAREERGTTIFHRRTDASGQQIPVIWDYQIKGFFKDACSFVRQESATASSDLGSFKSKIDGMFFPGPRMIDLIIPPGTSISVCERPLRADTPQGPRVSLCRSEEVPEGTTLSFTVTVLNDRLPLKEKKSATAESLLREWLDYGFYRGLGQWRNSGKGRFTYVLEDVTKQQQSMA